MIDTGFSNLRAVFNLLEFLGIRNETVTPKCQISKYDRVIIPGVSSFGGLTASIKRNDISRWISDYSVSGKPLIGICAGMQILFDSSDESPESSGLSLLPGKLKRFTPDPTDMNIGWRTIQGLDGKYYFVHRYYINFRNDSGKILFSEFNKEKFVALFQIKNLIGIQFHPEKSGADGVNLFRNIVGDGSLSTEKNYENWG